MHDSLGAGVQLYPLGEDQGVSWGVRGELGLPTAKTAAPTHLQTGLGAA